MSQREHPSETLCHRLPWVRRITRNAHAREVWIEEEDLMTVGCALLLVVVLIVALTAWTASGKRSGPAVANDTSPLLAN